MANGTVITTPRRTITPPTPWPVLPMPKPSAAKFTVWVNSVLANAADSDAAASSPSSRAWRGVSRSGGAHHGCGEPAGRGVRSAPRTGQANSQPNHGMSRR